MVTLLVCFVYFLTLWDATKQHEPAKVWNIHWPEALRQYFSVDELVHIRKCLVRGAAFLVDGVMIIRFGGLNVILSLGFS